MRQLISKHALAREEYRRLLRIRRLRRRGKGGVPSRVAVKAALTRPPPPTGFSMPMILAVVSITATNVKPISTHGVYRRREDTFGVSGSKSCASGCRASGSASTSVVTLTLPRCRRTAAVDAPDDPLDMRTRRSAQLEEVLLHF